MSVIGLIQDANFTGHLSDPNPPQAVFCVSLEHTHVFPNHVGEQKKKRRYVVAVLNVKLYCWMQVYVSKVSHRLIYGTPLLNCYTQARCETLR